MIKIKIAGIPIGIENRYTDIEMISRGYRTDETPVFTVTASDEDLEREQRDFSEPLPRDVLESTAIHRNIADRLPSYDAFLLHGSTVELDGNAYIFTAHSGVGKTTHTRLWLSEFADEVSVLNGDKPILRFIDGVPYACGTPWNGKENYGRNVMRPLRGIAFLGRGAENIAVQIEPKDAVTRFMGQIYLPKRTPALLSKTLILANKMLSSVTLVDLKCNMDPEAAHVCRAALTGGSSR